MGNVQKKIKIDEYTLHTFSSWLSYSRRLKVANWKYWCCFRNQPAWSEVVEIPSSSNPSLNTRTCTSVTQGTQGCNGLSFFTTINREKEERTVLNCFVYHCLRHTWFSSKEKNLNKGVHQSRRFLAGTEKRIIINK